MRVKHLLELLQKEVEKDPSVAELRLVTQFDCYGSVRDDEVENIKLMKLGYDEIKDRYIWDQPNDTKFLYLDIWPLHSDGSIPGHRYE